MDAKYYIFDHFSYHLRHSEKAEVVGMAAVDGAGIPERSFKQCLAVDEVHVFISLVFGGHIGIVYHLAPVG